MAWRDKQTPANSSPPLFVVCAAETSGDTLGAEVIKQLRLGYPNAIIRGMSGSKMRQQDMESHWDIEQVSVMGFWEVLKQLPRLLKLRRQMTQTIKQWQPTAVITIDAPDFFLNMNAKLKAAGIRCFHYVSPSVWAWKSERIKTIPQQVNGLMTLFPFEPALYQAQTPNFSASFVGHPLAQQIPLQVDKSLMQAKLYQQYPHIHPYQPIIAVLPGSRASEITQMAALYLQTVIQLATSYPYCQWVFVAANERCFDQLQRIMQTEWDKGTPQLANIHLVQGQSSQWLQAAQAGLITSGTATLEAALCKVPMVIGIRVSPLTYWIMKRKVTSSWVGLPNILCQSNIAPELIQQDATVDNFYKAMSHLLQHCLFNPACSQIKAYDQLHQTLIDAPEHAILKTLQRWLSQPD